MVVRTRSGTAVEATTPEPSPPRPPRSFDPQALTWTSEPASLEYTNSAVSAYLRSIDLPRTSALPLERPTLNSCAKPNMAFFTVVGEPSPPLTTSIDKSPTPPTLAVGLSPSEKDTLPRETPLKSPMRGANSPNGPPSCPDRIRSTAWACSSETLSSTNT